MLFQMLGHVIANLNDATGPKYLILNLLSISSGIKPKIKCIIHLKSS